MSWPAAHPGPWRLDLDEVACFTDQPILDANGEPVVVTDSGVYLPGPETARFVVEAVNACERLRDLVGRLADNIERYHLVGERDRALLREARAALGKGGQA